jgi:hypothetical protein
VTRARVSQRYVCELEASCRYYLRIGSQGKQSGGAARYGRYNSGNSGREVDVEWLIICVGPHVTQHDDGLDEECSIFQVHAKEALCVQRAVHVMDARQYCRGFNT